MNDDIVTRLRQGCSACGLHTLYACTDEAANEIERLRKIIVELKSQEMCDPNDPCEMCKE